MVPPNHPFVHRVFHYFHHPFWGFPPIFGNTHFISSIFQKTSSPSIPTGINDHPRPAVARHVEVDPSSRERVHLPPLENRNIIPTQKWRVRCNRDSNFIMVTHTIHVWYIYLHLPYFAIKNNQMYGSYGLCCTLLKSVGKKVFFGDMCFSSFPGRVILSILSIQTYSNFQRSFAVLCSGTLPLAL